MIADSGSRPYSDLLRVYTRILILFICQINTPYSFLFIYNFSTKWTSSLSALPQAPIHTLYFISSALVNKKISVFILGQVKVVRALFRYEAQQVRAIKIYDLFITYVLWSSKGAWQGGPLTRWSIMASEGFRIGLPPFKKVLRDS